MSLFQNLHARLCRALSPHDVKVTIRIDREVVHYLLPIIERIAPGTNEAWTALDAIRPFFRDDRPVTTIMSGNDIRFHEEGPLTTCGGQTYPLGAQVFINRLGWLKLGPVDARDLHAALREANDTAGYRWIFERDKLSRATPCREPRVRAIDDYLARLEMEAAARAVPPESETDHV